MSKTTLNNAIVNAHNNMLTVLPNGECVPFAVFNGGCSDNVLLLAGTGGGKTRTGAEPNIAAGASSIIVSDPKGTLYSKYKDTLEEYGFTVKRLNTRDLRSSDRFNAFEYIPDYNGAMKFASKVVDLKSSKESKADPMWNDLSKILISCAVGYLIEGGRYAPKNISGVIKIISTIDSNAMEQGRKCDFDRIFMYHNEEYKKNHNGESSWAYEQYKKFVGLAGKTLSSVVITVQSQLGSLDSPELRAATEADDMDIRSIGLKKTAVFVDISDTDRSKDLLVNLFFSFAMSELCDLADSQENHRLPVPVRFILDDFGTTTKIEGFESMISNIRSRGISVMIMVQSIAQLEQYYGKGYITILNNCDTTVYLGGNNYETAKYVSELVNKTPNSILTMPLKKCWIFRRGGSVVMADTVDIDCYKMPEKESTLNRELI